MTGQAAVQAERRMIVAGRGAPTTSFAELIPGSGGRVKSLLSADQDNAIIFPDPDKISNPVNIYVIIGI